MRKLLEAYFILGTEQTTLVLALIEPKKSFNILFKKRLKYGLLSSLAENIIFLGRRKRMNIACKSRDQKNLCIRAVYWPEKNPKSIRKKK
jgi:hypothetical protein